MNFWRTLRRSGFAASLVAALVLLGIGFSAGPASASTTDDSPSFQLVTVGENSGDYSAQSFSYTCFGNKGTFKDGSHILIIDWSNAGVECFGVSPSGAIWHTWDGASSWVEMPGNGRADDISYAYDYGDGNRTLEVWTGSYWCQNYWLGLGWTGSWYEC